MYYVLWIIVYWAHFDESLFIFKSYRYAPYFLTITFILPIIIKRMYNQKIVKDFLKYLEWTGYFAATIVFICLLFRVTSKETGAGYEIINLSETFRYVPIRGFFCLKQADLLSTSIIICVSGYMINASDKKRIIVKLPFVALCFLGIVISGSRSSFIFLCFSCAYLIITKGSLKKKIHVVIVTIVIGMFLLSFYHLPMYQHLFFRIFQSNYYTQGQTSINAKIDGYYIVGVKNFLKKPLLGNGMNKINHNYNYSHSIVISVLEDTEAAGLFIM